MSDFSKPITGFRFAATNYGDTLRDVAYRELGDASRWVELVWLNDLHPPYLVDDASLASEFVLVTGDQIKVPASRAASAVDATTKTVFETDLSLVNGRLSIGPDGDLALVTGAANLKQALLNRIETPRGDLVGHPNYGCSVSRLKGNVNGPTADQLAADYVKTSLLEDSRVSSVTSSTATSTGDQIDVAATVNPIAGRALNIATGV